jgi:hypothetical protein
LHQIGDLFELNVKLRCQKLIQNSIQNSLNVEIEKKCKTIDDEINNMVLTQTENLVTKVQFYPRVIKKTDIIFTDEEMTLINK